MPPLKPHRRVSASSRPVESTRLRCIRDGLTNCARRIAAEVSMLTTTADCETVIEREHRALLDSMTHQISTRLGKAVKGVE